MKQGRPESSVTLNVRITPRANEVLREMAGHERDCPTPQRGLGRVLCELIMQEHGRREALAQQRESERMQRGRGAQI
jgi:hypothetical protein